MLDHSILEAELLNNMTPDACDEYWMDIALALADRAETHGEVPVGAVLVLDNKMIGQGHNIVIHNHDASAHAEVMAIKDAGQSLSNYRLLNTVLYVTLEPCCMCAGAIIHSRIKRVVFGAHDYKTGAAGSAFSILEHDKHNHKVQVTAGVMAKKCSHKITEFFSKRRAEIKAKKKKI